MASGEVEQPDWGGNEDIWTVRTRDLPAVARDQRIYCHADDMQQTITANMIAATYPNNDMAMQETISFLQAFGFAAAGQSAGESSETGRTVDRGRRIATTTE